MAKERIVGKANMRVPFARPEFGQDEIAEVIEVIKSGWLTTASRTFRFESEFAEYVGSQYALAVNSGTAGLHLALEAAGIGPGDGVLVPTMTFTATAEVVRYLGADPVFVDCEPDTLCITADLIEDTINKEKSGICNPCPVKRKAGFSGAQSAIRLRGIIPVHFGGQACDMAEIQRIAGEYELKVIEDAAHALPSKCNGKMVGTIGQATVFSFYVTKPLATGEGGMVTTNSDEIAKRIKVMRLHGINKDIWDRYSGNKPNWYYEVVAPGFKYNMPDLMAAIGIHQLKKVARFQERREVIAKRYDEAFGDLPLKTPVVANPEDLHAWHLYVIQLELERLTINRDAVIEKMAEKGIGTSVHFIPLHLHPYWRDRYAFKPEDFPSALDCFKRAVSLPIYSRMTDEDVELVIQAVKEVADEYGH